MLSTVDAILFGIVQGLTEWLPVSSSGHFVILQEILNKPQPLVLNGFLHIGTLLVVLFAFRKDVFNGRRDGQYPEQRG